MTDKWGAEPIPSQAWDGDCAAGDKALTVLGEFLQAAINDDLSELWSSIAPQTRPVERVFTHDPKHKFNESALPALYLFVENSTTELESDDIDRDTRTLGVYWVARISSPKHEVLREAAQNVLGKVVSRACRIGRHRAWVAPGDTDLSAQYLGSFVLPFAGLERIKRMQSKPLELEIQLPGEDQRPKAFRGWATQLQISELYTRSVTASPNKAELTTEPQDPAFNVTDIEP